MGQGESADDGRITVTIVRTGGIAGLRRQWTVEASGDDAPRWISLIEQCPWDAPHTRDASADRYVWSVRARTREREFTRDVADGELSGSWRALVEAVRGAR
jgi:hypothetical protein